MTKVYHNAERSKGEVYKIIAIQDGELRINYDNLGDSILVVWILKMTKCRVGIRRLNPDEQEAYYREREILTLGEGI